MIFTTYIKYIHTGRIMISTAYIYYIHTGRMMLYTACTYLHRVLLCYPTERKVNLNLACHRFHLGGNRDQCTIIVLTNQTIVVSLNFFFLFFLYLLLAPIYYFNYISIILFLLLGHDFLLLLWIAILTLPILLHSPQNNKHNNCSQYNHYETHTT